MTADTATARGPVVVLDHAWPDLDRETAILAAAGLDLVDASTLGPDELAALMPTVSAIMTCWAPVSAALLTAATQCRTVARFGVGLDNIDVAQASQLGMSVTNVPDYCVDEVSDHALALTLALTRNIVALSADVKAGGWDNLAGGPMRRLDELSFGVVGLGRIGTRVIDKARAFGFQLRAHSHRAPEHLAPDVEFSPSLDHLLSHCDVVSLHLPLTDTTQHLIDGPALALMPPGAFVVNTSRGGLIDHDALLAAVRSGQLGGAGLDVLPTEPADADDPLRRTPGIILTPHASFSSLTAQHELRDRASRHVVDALAGSLPATTVNSSDLAAVRATQ